MIKNDKIKEGVILAKEHSEYFLKQSQKLHKEKEFQAAIPFAILAFEEASKVDHLIDYIKEKKDIEKDDWKELRYHKFKLTKNEKDSKEDLEDQSDLDFYAQSLILKSTGLKGIPSRDVAIEIKEKQIETNAKFSKIKEMCFYANWNSGKNEWAALNQSAYVYELIHTHDYSYEDIASAISISKSRVTQMIKAYETTLKYRDTYSDDDLWLRRYSHFDELWKRKTLKEWANDPHNLELFMKWVHDNQFPMAIKVRKLDAIIQDGKDAYKAIKKGATIDEAVEILQHQEEKRAITTKIADEVAGKVSDFQELLENFPRGKMKELAKDKERMKQFEELYKDFGQIIKDIKTISG